MNCPPDLHAVVIMHLQCRQIRMVHGKQHCWMPRVHKSWTACQSTSSNPETVRIWPTELTQPCMQALKTALTGVSTMLARGQIQPLPRTVHPMARVTDALREFSHAQHIGKLVAAAPEELPRERWAAWLVTGGLGALGLLTGRWLLEQSAQRIVLLGRTGRSVMLSSQGRKVL